MVVTLCTALRSTRTFGVPLPDADAVNRALRGLSEIAKNAQHVPSNLDLAGVAPLLCAGITTYSPMRHWGVAKGKKVGVVGLGDLVIRG